MDKNRIYTVKEVARLLGFSTNTIYKYLDEGKIKSTRLGKEGRFRIPQKEVAKLLGLKGVNSQIASDLEPEESHNLETERQPYKDASSEIPESSEEIQTNPNLKSRPKVIAFWGTSVVVLLLLVSVSVRNIYVSGIKSSESLPVGTAEVLSETDDAKPQEDQLPKPTPEATPKEAPKTITVKIDDEFSFVNIRQEPSTNSAKLGKALDGDTFEFVAKNAEWYELRLEDGLTGFISQDFMVEEASKE